MGTNRWEVMDGAGRTHVVSVDKRLFGTPTLHVDGHQLMRLGGDGIVAFEVAGQPARLSPQPDGARRRELAVRLWGHRVRPRSTAGPKSHRLDRGRNPWLRAHDVPIRLARGARLAQRELEQAIRGRRVVA